MGGKPVIYRDAKKVLFDSPKFGEKRLCDGLTLNLGDTCSFSCTYCYAARAMLKIDKKLVEGYNAEHGSALAIDELVIRRRNAVDVLRGQLLDKKGEPIFNDPSDTRVVYSSTLVDAAGNMDLVKESAKAFNMILEHSAFQIRVLSKGSLLERLVELIRPEHRARMIFGYSTGTLDPKLSKLVERGTAPVLKRIESLHRLQDSGMRTFGMICPSLPQRDYSSFSREICEAIRVDRCETVWAEIINPRGTAMKSTVEALRDGGEQDAADRLERIIGAGNRENCEEYARATFLAHAENIPPEKLRFLQYQDKKSVEWWASQRERGAVLLGSQGTPSEVTPVSGETGITPVDRAYRDSREKVVTLGVNAGIHAAVALAEIHNYRKGLLWKSEFSTFEEYCKERWELRSSHSYRMIEYGNFIEQLRAVPVGEKYLPKREAHVRPVMRLPKNSRVEFWKTWTETSPMPTLTARSVTVAVKKFGDKLGLFVKAPKKDNWEKTKTNFLRLRSALESGKAGEFQEIQRLIEELGRRIDEAMSQQRNFKASGGKLLISSSVSTEMVGPRVSQRD